MNITKELVLREYGDEGADTLEKHWAQIEYTAYLCSLMLSSTSGIIGVIPEGIEDVCIVHEDSFELHQVKCRDNTQPPWTTAEILPILSKLYHHRLAFDKLCEFHFVSDYVADSKTQLRPGTYGALAKLKQLLDIRHDGYGMRAEEEKELAELEVVIVGRIVALMLEEHYESVETSLASELLARTHIETGSKRIRNHVNYDELAEIIAQAFPGQIELRFSQLHDFYERILLLIIKKILRGGNLEQRTISRDDILNCRYQSQLPEIGLPDLDLLPGSTVADKKALYGGFCIDEMPVFAKQRLNTQMKKRKLEALGLSEQITDLSLNLITVQRRYRRNMSNQLHYRGIGPEILKCLEDDFPSCIQDYFHNHEVDSVFCHGLIWQETNDCTLWWHRFSETKGVDDGQSSSLK